MIHSFNSRIGIPLQVRTYDPYEERAKCAENRCEAKKGDNRCDDECNTHFCDYDGGDCRIGLNPWKECTVSVFCNIAI